MRALLITLIVLSARCAAASQIDEDWKACKAEDVDEATVSACTHLIETNELGADDRAGAYCRRGAAYWRNPTRRTSCGVVRAYLDPTAVFSDGMVIFTF